MRKAIDRYTGTLIEETPKSSIPHITRGRSLFAQWRQENANGPQYAAHDTEDGWLIYREGEWLPMLGPYPSDKDMKPLLQWLIMNDASLLITLGWVKRGIPEPLLKFVEKANEI